jgi:hypothetical protein
VSRLAAEGVRFETQHHLDDARLSALFGTADAVFIGLDDPNLPAGWRCRFSETTHPQTLETSVTGLFCGDLGAANRKASFVFDMAEGRKGALSGTPRADDASPLSANRSIGVCDPCASRHDTAVQKTVRGLLSDRKFSVEEIPFHGKTAQCCGFGGLMAAANPELGEKVINGQIQRNAADWVIYCAMCRDRLFKGGKRIAHVLQVLFPDAGADPFESPAPGWSERHENRGRFTGRALA